MRYGQFLFHKSHGERRPSWFDPQRICPARRGRRVHRRAQYCPWGLPLNGPSDMHSGI
jgi:hypothetical protein